MITRAEIVGRARSFVGCRFRPQGRIPELGLDCVGLVMRVFAISSEEVRRDYPLRGASQAAIERELSRFFVRVAPASAGDVLLCRAAREQLHLAIHCGDSFVHADAGLRRVVEVPGGTPWPLIANFRHPWVN